MTVNGSLSSIREIVEAEFACEHDRTVHVHHFSYRHFGNEPLFDLISVCVTCHNALHIESHDEPGTD